MIKIVKDMSKQYNSLTFSIEVKNMKDYFEARKMFFKCYKNNEDLEIIIKSKNYFPYFLDFENYKDVQTKEILEMEEPKIDLGSSTNIFEILLSSKGITMENRKKLEYLKNEYLNEYSFLFEESSCTVDTIIENLVKIVMFSAYRQFNFNILLDNNAIDLMYDVAKNDDKLKKDFEEMRGQLSEYIKNCNGILKKNSKKIQLFNEIPTIKYLEEINGGLEFEEEYFLKKNIERLNFLRDFEDIKNSLKKAQEIFGSNYDEVFELINHLVIITKDMKNEKTNFEDYKEYFQNIYLKYNSISSENNINFVIGKIEKRYCVELKSLKTSIGNIWRESNRNFEEFYLKEYSGLYSSSSRKGLDYAIENSLGLLSNGKKNLYLFIDCLRYDVWIEIKRYLQKREWNCHLDKILLSAIPTVTSYCKKTLYTGKKYNQIDSPKNYKIDMKNIDNIEQLGMIEDENILYEILDLDSLFHSIKDLNEGCIYSIIETRLDKILEVIDKDKYNLIIMTDHGAMRLFDEGLCSFSKHKNIVLDKGLEIENHGRYIKIYSRYFSDEIYEELGKYFNNIDEFYTINREEMGKYYLPIVENTSENYFYLIYKYGKFPKNTGEYNHGGISLEEVFIPYGVFKGEVKEVVPIDVEVKNIEIVNSTKSEINLLIRNSNYITKLELKMKYNDFQREYKEFDGNKLLQIPLKLEENYVGEFSDIVEIEYEIDGKKENLKKRVVINILENKKATINKKLRKSRALL